jgi:hypothetical protein
LTQLEILGVDGEWATVRLGEVEASVQFGDDLASWEQAVRAYLASVDAAPPELRPARLYPALFDLRKPPRDPTTESILRALKLGVIPPKEALDALARQIEEELLEYDVLSSPHASLERAESPVVEARGVRVTLRLLTWDVDQERKMIRDIKEQECLFVPMRHAGDPERVLAYVRAWIRAVTATLVTRGLGVETFMPVDFVTADVLDLRASTDEEFEPAIAKRLARL